MRNKYTYDEKEKLVEDINALNGYRGYVQFSHRALDKNDIFEDRDPSIEDKKGFVYEAHFCNGTESIMVRQLNGEWVVSTADISKVDKKDIEFYALEKTSNLKEVKSNWVKMAQIWKPQKNELCEEMEVMKLQKVVFAGFEEKKGEV